jgi:hypothetical protein
LAKTDKTILAFEFQLYFPTEQQLFNGMMEVKRQMRKKENGSVEEKLYLCIRQQKKWQ